MVRTIKSKDKSHRWQIRVAPVQRGHHVHVRDDSEGKWSPWKQVFPGLDGGIAYQGQPADIMQRLVNHFGS